MKTMAYRMELLQREIEALGRELDTARRVVAS
jgi:hypothetical protein